MLITWLMITVMFGIAELLTWKWWFLPTSLGALAAAVASLVFGSLVVVAFTGFIVAVGVSLLAGRWNQKHHGCNKAVNIHKVESAYFEPTYAWAF